MVTPTVAGPFADARRGHLLPQVSRYIWYIYIQVKKSILQIEKSTSSFIMIHHKDEDKMEVRKSFQLS